VVGGRDRLRFLHAVTTQDVQGLAPGQGATAALVDDRGRPIAGFRLYVLPEAVLLETPSGRADALFAALERLVVADDVVLAWADGAPVVVEADTLEEALALLAPARRGHGWFVPPAAALAGSTLAAGWNAETTPPGELDDPAALAALPRVRETMLLASRYGGSGLLDWSGPLPGAASDDALDAREIDAFRPGPAELAEARVWNELGAMDAVSFTKGCFMGQEILNRVASQGNLQRRLVRLTGASGVGAGAPLVDADGAEAGTITRAAQGRAFAFVRRGAWDAGTRLLAKPANAPAVPVEVA
jgi:folate-binding protein YgfZ